MKYLKTFEEFVNESILNEKRMSKADYGPMHSMFQEFSNDKMGKLLASHIKPYTLESNTPKMRDSKNDLHAYELEWIATGELNGDPVTISIIHSATAKPTTREATYHLQIDEYSSTVGKESMRGFTDSYSSLIYLGYDNPEDFSIKSLEKHFANKSTWKVFDRKMKSFEQS